jgi:aryl-alcohol dehydrogenase-like predicted oxidoreductase
MTNRPARVTLDKRPLGDTGLLVSPLGLGLAAVGRPGYINLGRDTDLGNERSTQALEALAFELLDEAWALGVRYVDVARSYGHAEAFLGRWLAARDHAEGDLVIGSKWGYTYTAAWRVDAQTHEVKEHSLTVLRRQWGETRERLGAHVDLYQVHSVTPDSPALDDPSLVSELASLKAQGMRIGLSTSGPDQADTVAQATRVTVDGVRLFDTVQATWNLLETSVGAALEEARAAGMGVIVKEALANGRLTDHNTDPDFAPQRATLSALAEVRGVGIDALALAAALAQPWADVVLSGAATTAHLRANALALDLPWDDDITAALAPLAEAPDAYWSTRSDLPWS